MCSQLVASFVENVVCQKWNTYFVAFIYDMSNWYDSMLFLTLLAIRPKLLITFQTLVFSLGLSYRMGRVYKRNWTSLQRWSIRLLVGFTDPYNHTYSESLWWKLFKNHQRTQIQRQRQWQRQRQRQRHRQSAWKTRHMLYFYRTWVRSLVMLVSDSLTD